MDSVLMRVKKPCSGGSRKGARRARLPPLFLDQNEAEKIFFWDGARPYLRTALSK